MRIFRVLKIARRLVEVGLHIVAAGDAAGRAEIHELVVSACNRRVGQAGAKQAPYQVGERADSVHLLGEKDTG